MSVDVNADIAQYGQNASNTKIISDTKYIEAINPHIDKIIGNFKKISFLVSKNIKSKTAITK
jgi:hypothetical protein